MKTIKDLKVWMVEQINAGNSIPVVNSGAGFGIIDSFICNEERINETFKDIEDSTELVEAEEIYEDFEGEELYNASEMTVYEICYPNGDKMQIATWDFAHQLTYEYIFEDNDSINDKVFEDFKQLSCLPDEDMESILEAHKHYTNVSFNVQVAYDENENAIDFRFFDPYHTQKGIYTDGIGYSNWFLETDALY